MEIFCLATFVIDFDLTRKAEEPHVKGYNYIDFQEFHHAKAWEGEKMIKEHDLHSLRRMSCYFFDLGQSNNVNSFDLDELIKFVEEHADLPQNSEVELDDEAKCSPTQQHF